MAAPLVCSECGVSLKGRSRSARTCSDKCRTARSNRLRAQHQREADWQEKVVEGGADPATREMRLAVRSEMDDRIRRILDKELEPIVRESITEDVQRSIAALLALTPAAVAAIAEDLTQEDSYDRRQKAYTLLMKYTAGHTKLVPDVDPKPAQMITFFEGMPRPNVIEAEVVNEDEFTCNACASTLHESERAAPGADRCRECHAALQERLKEIRGAP